MAEPRRRSLVWIASALVLALGSVSCHCDSKNWRDRQADQVTPEGPATAREPVVDEDFRFRLDWPGEGWKLLHEAQARHQDPRMVAAATAGANWGGVIVERRPSFEIDHFLREEIYGRGPTRLIERGPRRLAGVDGEQVVLRQTLDGAELYRVIVILRRGEWIYQLHGWQPAIGAPQLDALEPFFASFALLEGEVRGRAPLQVIDDAAGIGWRIVDGTFESAVSGLRVDPPESLRLIAGPELRWLGSNVEFVLERDDFRLIAVPNPASPRGVEQRRAAILAGMIAEGAEDDPAGPLSLELDGRPLVFDRLRLTDGGRQAVGVLAHAEGLVVLIARWASEAGGAHLREAVAAIETLDEDAHRSLRAALVAGEDPEFRIGPTYVLRGGLLRDFDSGLRWRKPAGLWRTLIRTEAHAIDERAHYMLRDLESSATAALRIEELDAELDGPSWHAQARTRWSEFDDPGEPAGALDEHQEFLRSSTSFAVDSGEIVEISLITKVEDGRGLALVYRSYRGRRRPHLEVLAELAGGLSVVPAPAVELRDGEYVDRRQGLALKPPKGWTRRDLTPQAIAALARIVQWKRGLGEIYLISMCSPQLQHDLGWFEARAEQVLRDAIGEKIPGRSERWQEQVAGRQATRLRWGRSPVGAEATLIADGACFHAVGGRLRPRSPYADVLASLRLLE